MGYVGRLTRREKERFSPNKTDARNGNERGSTGGRASLTVGYGALPSSEAPFDRITRFTSKVSCELSSNASTARTIASAYRSSGLEPSTTPNRYSTCGEVNGAVGSIAESR